MTNVGVDLFDFAGENWLAMVDYYSGYLFGAKLKRTATSDVINELQRWFQTFGYPEVLHSDNGPQFRGEMKLFCQEKGIVHETSSPYFPSANGAAESAVKNLKSLLKKTRDADEDFHSALAAFQAMPREDGFSPNQLLYGRSLCGNLPRLADTTRRDICPSGREARNMIQARKSAQFDTGARNLPDLLPGQHVVLQNPTTKLWDEYGVITDVHHSGRSYIVSTEGERSVRRNRRFMKPFIHEIKQEISSDVKSEETPFAPRRSKRLQSKNVQFN